MFFFLYFLIPVVIAQISNPVADYVPVIIPIGIPTKEAKAEMETHPVIAEIKTTACSV